MSNFSQAGHFFEDEWDDLPERPRKRRRRVSSVADSEEDTLADFDRRGVKVSGPSAFPEGSFAGSAISQSHRHQHHPTPLDSFSDFDLPQLGDNLVTEHRRPDEHPREAVGRIMQAEYDEERELRSRHDLGVEPALVETLRNIDYSSVEDYDDELYEHERELLRTRARRDLDHTLEELERNTNGNHSPDLSNSSSEIWEDPEPAQLRRPHEAYQRQYFPDEAVPNSDGEGWEDPLNFDEDEDEELQHELENSPLPGENELDTNVPEAFIHHHHHRPTISGSDRGSGLGSDDIDDIASSLPNSPLPVSSSHWESPSPSQQSSPEHQSSPDELASASSLASSERLDSEEVDFAGLADELVLLDDLEPLYANDFNDIVARQEPLDEEGLYLAAPRPQPQILPDPQDYSAITRANLAAVQADLTTALGRARTYRDQFVRHPAPIGDQADAEQLIERLEGVLQRMNWRFEQISRALDDVLYPIDPTTGRRSNRRVISRADQDPLEEQLSEIESVKDEIASRLLDLRDRYLQQGGLDRHRLNRQRQQGSHLPWGRPGREIFGGLGNFRDRQPYQRRRSASPRRQAASPRRNRRDDLDAEFIRFMESRVSRDLQALRSLRPARDELIEMEVEPGFRTTRSNGERLRHPQQQGLSPPPSRPIPTVIDLTGDSEDEALFVAQAPQPRGQAGPARQHSLHAANPGADPSHNNNQSQDHSQGSQNLRRRQASQFRRTPSLTRSDGLFLGEQNNRLFVPEASRRANFFASRNPVVDLTSDSPENAMSGASRNNNHRGANANPAGVENRGHHHNPFDGQLRPNRDREVITIDDDDDNDHVPNHAHNNHRHPLGGLGRLGGGFMAGFMNRLPPLSNLLNNGPAQFNEPIPRNRAADNAANEQFIAEFLEAERAIGNPLQGNMPNLNYGANGYNNPPNSRPHVPPPAPRDGFTRDTGEDQVFVCPSCEEELAFDPDEDDTTVNAGKKARTRKDREEHWFWAVKECGHVFCSKCYNTRRDSSLTDFRHEGKKLFCAVDGCTSDVSTKTAWVGLFL